MDRNAENYCLILAGGKGRRLWPCSREAMPKQFIDFFGMGQTQLQQTYNRFAAIVPKNNILVSTNQEYAGFVREQLPELPEENIIAEPIFRNTAPSVAWGCFRIRRRCSTARVIVTPSDQMVFNEEAFRHNVLEGLEFVAENDSMLAMGVKPTRPEPGYGYIQLGDDTPHEGISRVKSFTEKPEREFARMFMDSGEFYWNTGMYLASVDVLVENLHNLLHHVMYHLDDTGVILSLAEEQEYVRENFPRYPNLSIDSGILEKSPGVYVMHSDFGWADLGTWHSAYEAMSRQEGDNVVIDSEVLMEDSRNNIVKIPSDHLAVINGLDGYIVAEQGNVLFICKKEDSSALVRKYVNEVGIKYGKDYI